MFFPNCGGQKRFSCLLLQPRFLQSRSPLGFITKYRFRVYFVLFRKKKDAWKLLNAPDAELMSLCHRLVEFMISHEINAGRVNNSTPLLFKQEWIHKCMCVKSIEAKDGFFPAALLIFENKHVLFQSLKRGYQQKHSGCHHLVRSGD